jgi:hypothetical protein
LWISDAATDSGKGSSLSSTITRRTSEMKRTPRNDPSTMSDVDFQ